MSGTYLQALGEDKKTFKMLVGKAVLLIPILAMFTFIPQLNQLISSNWKFANSDGVSVNVAVDRILHVKADLGLFLALPVVDVLIFFLLINYMISSEQKIISKMPHKKRVNTLQNA